MRHGVPVPADHLQAEAFAIQQVTNLRLELIFLITRPAPKPLMIRNPLRI